MRPVGPAVLASALLILVGVMVLKGSVAQDNDDPTASVMNGAPRGLLALSLLFAARGAPVQVLRSFEDPAPLDGALVVLPPPERSSWTDQEVGALLAWVGRGGRALVLCDEDEARNRRLGALLEAVGATCERVDVAIGDVALSRAQGTTPAFTRELSVRGAGRARPKGAAPVLPAWRVGNEDVVIKRQLGDGAVTVVGSATVLANDGLASAGNAAFALDEQALAPVSTVVFDERHHRTRNEGVWAAAFTRGSGPLTGLLALLLLVPLSLLSLAPRPGDAPSDDDDGGAPAAAAQAAALAALLARAGR